MSSTLPAFETFNRDFDECFQLLKTKINQLPHTTQGILLEGEDLLNGKTYKQEQVLAEIAKMNARIEILWDFLFEFFSNLLTAEATLKELEEHPKLKEYVEKKVNTKVEEILKESENEPDEQI